MILNYQQCLDKLSKIKMITINGVPTQIKEVPELTKGLDPRVKIQRLKPKVEFSKVDDTVFEGIEIGRIRQGMGFDNLDISEGIIVKHEILDGVPVRIYYPINHKGLLPALIFIHGGGFYGGDLNVVENPCKAMAQKAHVVVVSIDYRLSPEAPFPHGLNDCDTVVNYIFNHANDLGIDSNRVGISGDSAGGNLAAGCVLRDVKSLRRIKYMALLYPVVSLSEEGYQFSLDQYTFESDDELVKRTIHSIKNCMPLINELYVRDEIPLVHPQLSPLMVEDLSQFPKTLIVSAEYDFLRLQDEAYVNRLNAAGVEVRYIQYKGMDHAFLDKCGVYPQAEDCMNEIAKDLKKI